MPLVSKATQHLGEVKTLMFWPGTSLWAMAVTGHGVPKCHRTQHRRHRDEEEEHR